MGCGESYATNTLILISDLTKGLYTDWWEDGILHYTGMGGEGDQSLDRQNKTLNESDINGVEVHLFEVKKVEYTKRNKGSHVFRIWNLKVIRDCNWFS